MRVIFCPGRCIPSRSGKVSATRQLSPLNPPRIERVQLPGASCERGRITSAPSSPRMPAGSRRSQQPDSPATTPPRFRQRRWDRRHPCRHLLCFTPLPKRGAGPIGIDIGIAIGIAIAVATAIKNRLEPRKRLQYRWPRASAGSSAGARGRTPTGDPAGSETTSEARQVSTPHPSTLNPVSIAIPIAMPIAMPIAIPMPIPMPIPNPIPNPIPWVNRTITFPHHPSSCTR